MLVCKIAKCLYSVNVIRWYIFQRRHYVFHDSLHMN